jgi:hypothetical protein
MKIVSLGSDPEFACYDQELKKYISLVGKFEGTKEEPQVISELPDCCNLIDCCGLEFTMAPTKTLGELFDKINTLVNYHNKVLKTMNSNWILRAVSSAEYDQDQLDSPEANTFGCSPSWSIYKGQSLRSAEQAGNIRSYGK